MDANTILSGKELRGKPRWITLSINTIFPSSEGRTSGSSSRGLFKVMIDKKSAEFLLVDGGLLGTQ
ncbi:MAG: hypothetical protein KF749_07920 [Bacteroidetes bacterium]|nr:hypothetical protein [Bacteroidota bacterium]MCW5894929.1 hypothetical protein [Bacteroidota bacterium]